MPVFTDCQAGILTKISNAYKTLGLLIHFANRQCFVDSVVRFFLKIFPCPLKKALFPKVVYNCHDSQENASNCG